jgi:hypothetical protein
MVNSIRWKLRRYITLAVVLTLHGTLIAGLLMTSGAGRLPASNEHAVQLLLIPPVSLPRVRSEHAPPRQLRSDISITTAPVALGSLSMSAPPASFDGKGSGVDWAAEAHRALQSYEIRHHQPPSYAAVSGDPGDEWLRQLQRHAGDQIRTPNGDWIVWISANCYQVAKSGPGAFVPGAMVPQTICRDLSGTAAR